MFKEGETESHIEAARKMGIYSRETCTDFCITQADIGFSQCLRVRMGSAVMMEMSLSGVTAQPIG